MTALLTPEQIEEISARDADYVDELPRTADIGTKDRRALLRDREAICERLEKLEQEFAKMEQVHQECSTEAYFERKDAMESQWQHGALTGYLNAKARVKDLVTAIRGEK